MSDYTPIECELYERFELAIMRGERLLLCWRDPDGLSHLEPIMPRDLRTEKGKEFLLAERDGGLTCQLRLDAILTARPAPHA
ncbi:MAG: transcriptional antiterminator, Rof [Gammaproteobacteria bacterium]